MPVDQAAEATPAAAAEAYQEKAKPHRRSLDKPELVKYFEEELRVQRRDKADMKQQLQDLKTDLAKLNSQMAAMQQ